MLRTRLNMISRNLICIFACMGLLACQAADGTSQAPDTALVNAVMKGLGAVDPNEKPIEYKPRAPLAMPSNPKSLPQPMTADAGARSSSWPTPSANKDLEEVKKIYASSNDDPSRRLTPNQMRGIKINGPKRTRDVLAERRDAELSAGARMTHSELNAENSSATALTAERNLQLRGAKPVRRYLTEPPVKYSQTTDGSLLPVVVDDKKAANDDAFYSGKRLNMRCLNNSSSKECRKRK